MKKITKLVLSALCAAMIALPVCIMAACGEGGSNSGGKDPSGDNTPDATIDYVSDLKLNLNSSSKKQEVTVKTYIDGDTTHFNPVTNSTLTGYNAADFAETDGYIKARYLAIDTPESTGDIEKWGKAASNFTHDKLADAKSIIVESDDEKWNIDSTGSRYTLWIWYMPSNGTEYRNLNIEILQNGFAYASNTANNRYGETAMAALNQAKAQKLHVYAPDSEVDELFYDGDALTVDLQTLRFKPDKYSQKIVRVQGVVVAYFNNTAYIEEEFTDQKTGEKFYCGMPVFDGYQVGKIKRILTVGNYVEIVGTFTQHLGSWQISGIRAGEMKYNPDTDSKIIESDYDVSKYLTSVSAYDIMNEEAVTRTVTFEEVNEDGEEVFVDYTISYAASAIATSVTLTNLKVNRFTTTTTSGSNGALSLYCTAEDGTQITIRTEPLFDEDGVLVTGDMFNGKTITVYGLIEKYTYDYEKNPDNYQYQVKVYQLANIIIA